MTTQEMLIEQALLAALTGSAVNALVSGRIYGVEALAEYPRVQFILNSGGDTNTQLSREGDYRYVVKAITDENTGGAALAAQIAGAIESVLHNGQLNIGLPYHCHACQRTTGVRFVEQVDRRKFYHHGAMYRIRLSEEV